MRIRLPRAGSHARRVVVAAVVVVGSAFAIPSSAVPIDEQGLEAAETSVIAERTGSAPNDDLPGAGDLPPVELSSGYGVVTNSQGAVTRRSKMYITIGPDDPIFGLLFLYMKNWPLDNPTEFRMGCLPASPIESCVVDPFYQPSCATSDPATQRLAAYYKHLMYPVEQLDRGVDVGKMATVKVNLVAFGAIPASATLELRAPRVAGKVEPFTVHGWTTYRPGCEPNSSAPLNTVFAEGRVEIRIADLTVDGVPVEVGTHCRTRSPAELQLWNEPTGYTPGGGGDLGAYDGLHSGTRGRLQSPLYGKDNGRVLAPSTGMTIPPFTGCGAGGDDLSPLVTAMASGPNNPVRITQGKLVAQTDGSVDLNNLEACDEQGTPVCPLPGPDIPERPPLQTGETP